MKTFFQLLSAGIVGGLIVLGGIRLTQSDIPSDIPLQRATLANMNMAPGANVAGDFVESAKKTVGSVVYIYAEESDEQVEAKRRTQRRSDPFFDLFGFDEFFGGNNFFAPKKGSGSGVIYSSDGYIITNNHVVGFADKLSVTDSEGNKYTAKKIGTDETTDLAVIKIEGAKNLVPIKMGDSESVKVGEWVLAIGNPFGYLTSTVTAGIVSAKGRSIDFINSEKSVEEFIQTDAAINPGNSGGALVNLQGELIGINTAIATPTGVFAGYSFAIPSKIVKNVVNSIIENGGNIERTSLGVGGYDVNDDLIKEFGLNLKGKKGFYIEEVDKRSAAQMGGLIPGDVIIEINNLPIQNYNDIEKTLKYNKVGDNINIKVNRNGKEILIPIQLRKSF